MVFESTYHTVYDHVGPLSVLELFFLSILHNLILLLVY